MVSISSLFKNISNYFTDQRPLSNTPEYTHYDDGLGLRQPSGYEDISTYVKTSPELITILDCFVNDILSDGYYFEGTPSAVKKAEVNSELIDLKQVLKKWLIEGYGYGNGFLVVNNISEDQILAKAKEIMKKNGFETKEAQNQLILKGKAIVKKNLYKNINLDHLPAENVSIYSEDKYGEKVKFKQKVDENEEIFDSRNIVHFKDFEIDGSLWGYPRLFSFKSELQMLADVKDYVGTFFDNNGTPNFAIIAENLQPGSKEYENLKKTFSEFRKSKNRQKNLLLTSKLGFERLNDFNKDMEFHELVKYLTSLISMAYGMPSNRYGVPSGAKSEETTLTNQGYYRNISAEQDKIEKLLNRKYFLPFFNVRIKFNRSYKEDEVREVNILKTKMDVIEQGKKIGTITRKKAADLLNIKEDELPDEEEWDKSDSSEQYMQGQMSDVELEDENEKNKRLNKTPDKYKGTDSDNKLKK